MRRRSIALAVLAPLSLLLAAFAVPVIHAGGGCHGPATEPGDGPASVVKIDGCMFYPTIARVPTGTTVEFLNTGDAPHNVTGVSGMWASAQLTNGAKFRHTFAEPGIYPFACTLHPGMNGAVVVGAGMASIDGSAGGTTTAEAAAPDVSTAAATDEGSSGASGPLLAAGLVGAVLGATVVAMASAAMGRRRNPLQPIAD